MKKNPQLGDVYIAHTATSQILIQHVKFHDSLGYLVRVFVIKLTQEIENVDLHLQRKEDFHVFFYLKDAIKSGQIKFLKNSPLEVDYVVPKYFRAEAIIPHPKWKWQILELGVVKQTLVEKLTDEQAAYPPFQIWTIEGLVNKIDCGFELSKWR